MSLYANPGQHAANPPETWQVTKYGPRSWRVVDQAGTTLEYFPTRRDALAAISDPRWWVNRLYEQERRWYAGETIPRWRPYVATATTAPTRNGAA